METFTISEAARLLEGQISREALKKRVQRPDAPGGLRSVKGSDGKRRIPRSELERAGLRLNPVEDSPASLIRELVEKIADQERELMRLRALPERVQSVEAEKREVEQRAAALEAWREEVQRGGFWQRRRLLREAA
jgi:vacuolar-type H+-ATPase subunit I/STV1